MQADAAADAVEREPTPAARQAIHFFDATKAIFTTPNPERLPEVIVQAAITVMDADAVTLFLPRDDGNLYVAHASGLPEDVRMTARVVLGEGIAGRVAEAQTPTVLTGAVTGGHGRAKSSIIYPLVSNGRLMGLLTFSRMASHSLYAEDDLESAAVLASQILLALENSRLARQSALSDKLAAVGQLAAGIAHEINTPIQFIGDSSYFLRGAMEDLQNLIGKYRSMCDTVRDGGDPSQCIEELAALEEDLQLDYLREEIPKAIDRSLEGVRRVAEIVLAVKSFGRVELKEKTRADINQLLQTTVIVARPEYRDVAELKLELGDLQPLLCYPSDLNQVLLNLIVNASHAIADVHRKTGGDGSDHRAHVSEHGVVSIGISDTGTRHSRRPCGTRSSSRSSPPRRSARAPGLVWPLRGRSSSTNMTAASASRPRRA